MATIRTRKPAAANSLPLPDPVAAAARNRKSSALYLLACIFLATGVLRANDLRHDVVALLGSPAHAATDPSPHPAPPAETHNAKAAAMSAPGDAPAHEPTMPPKSMSAVAKSGHSAPGLAPKGDMAPTANDRCLTGAFLKAALEREQELNAMALHVDTRNRELQVTEKRVADQLAELAQQQKALATAFGQADAASEEEAMQQLVSIYEKMKPKQAAQIFDQMPPEVGAGFVRRMRQNSSAQIMANMDAQKAYAISLLLAGRSSAVRKQ